jgi:uncharacterized Zn-binding protein involved in type VI secretion
VPGFLYHVGAQTNCPHMGQATTVSTNSRVLVSGQPVAILTDTTTIAGCPFQIPTPAGPKPQPCVKVLWTVGATRVFVNGQPVLLQTSVGVCQSVEQIPQGPPTVVATQTRVVGT